VLRSSMLRRPQVERLTGLSRSSIYAMMARGDFPKPIRLGKRAVGWKLSIIEEWLSSRAMAGERPP
jgi:prophage regulatory protein